MKFSYRAVAHWLRFRSSIAGITVLFVLIGLSTGTPAQESRTMSGSQLPLRGEGLQCGDLFYDDGSVENAIFFGGGQAGEDDHFLGVRFELADFGLPPGTVELTGFCVGNQLDFSAAGGPWPNEVFVYRDLGGIPDLDNPQRQATISTGDGRGAFEVVFDHAWPIAEPVFWIMARGDPMHAGEDFNIESDQSAEPAGKSWLADRGVPFMIQTGQNLMIRATIRPARSAAAAVPVLSPAVLVVLAILLLLAASRALAGRPTLDQRQRR
ncbi:MAG: hypothetical protein ABR550_00570 [Wenzhouxiangellaceae bacterium]